MVRVFIKDIVDWYIKNNKIPQITKQDSYENTLAKSLDYYRKLNINESIELDNSIPHWRKKTHSKAYNNAISTINFYKKYNRFPTQIRPVNRERTENENEEYRLACWLNGLKHNNIKNKFVIIILNNNCPNWNKRNDPEQNAINQANNVLKFWNKYKRLPKQINKNDKNNDEEYEYRLATWINSQKQSVKGNNTLYIYPKVIDILNEIPNIF